MDTEDVCMICFESTPVLLKVCNCNTLIHENCLKSVIMNVNSHKSSCPICKVAYPVKVTTRLQMTLINNAWVIIAAHCISIFFTASTLIFIIFNPFHTKEQIAVNTTILLVDIVLFALVIFLHWLLYTRSGQLCCLRWKDVPTDVSICIDDVVL